MIFDEDFEDEMDDEEFDGDEVYSFDPDFIYAESLRVKLDILADGVAELLSRMREFYELATMGINKDTITMTSEPSSVLN